MKSQGIVMIFHMRATKLEINREPKNAPRNKHQFRQWLLEDVVRWSETDVASEMD